MKNILFLFLSSIVILVGCQKSDSESSKSIREQLLGRWNIVAYGQDSIPNASVDSGEISVYDGFAYVFQSDGKGLNIQWYLSGGFYVVDTVKLSWVLSQNEGQIISVYSDPLHPIIDSVVDIKNNQILLLDNSSDYGSAYNHWKKMKKQ